jgi:3-methyladenine DNA glycosylase AlkC
MDEHILNLVLKERIGFKVKETLANEYAKTHSSHECFKEGYTLHNSEDYGIRAFGVFLIGQAAHNTPLAVEYLETHVSKDKNWRVQEILAMAFALFYKKIGHIDAHPTFERWLTSTNPNLRRAVTEGLRPWIAHEPFHENPSDAVLILSRFRDDESEYVRKSAGNALKDIGKKNRDLIINEVNTWDLSDKRVRQTWKHAMRLINKEC